MSHIQGKVKLNDSLWQGQSHVGFQLVGISTLESMCYTYYTYFLMYCQLHTLLSQ